MAINSSSSRPFFPYLSVVGQIDFHVGLDLQDLQGAPQKGVEVAPTNGILVARFSGLRQDKIIQSGGRKEKNESEMPLNGCGCQMPCNLPCPISPCPKPVVCQTRLNLSCWGMHAAGRQTGRGTIMCVGCSRKRGHLAIYLRRLL